MKKIFPTPLATVLVILYLTITVSLNILVPKYFDLPKWSTFSLYVAIIWFAWAIPARFGSDADLKKRFSFLWEATTKDRVLFFTSLIGIIFLNFLEGFYLKEINLLFGLFISSLNFFILLAIVNLFGSVQFKQIFNQKFFSW